MYDVGDGVPPVVIYIRPPEIHVIHGAMREPKRLMMRMILRFARRCEWVGSRDWLSSWTDNRIERGFVTGPRAVLSKNLPVDIHDRTIFRPLYRDRGDGAA